MKKFLFCSIFVSFTLVSCDTLQQLVSAPTNLETISALKEVLNSSTFRAISSLQKLNNQGAEALLPDEIKPVLSTLRTLGLGGEVDKVAQSITKYSGVALKESSGIMTDAIGELSFTDAVSVVTGGEDAATQVLRQAMYSSVKKRYSTNLNTELAKTDALKYWPMATSAYNMFSKDKIEGDLSDFIAEKSVDALFSSMGKEEKAIRQDPASLGKAVVTKVFDYYKGK